MLVQAIIRRIHPSSQPNINDIEAIEAKENLLINTNVAQVSSLTQLETTNEPCTRSTQQSTIKYNTDGSISKKRGPHSEFSL